MEKHKDEHHPLGFTLMTINMVEQFTFPTTVFHYLNLSDVLKFSKVSKAHFDTVHSFLFIQMNLFLKCDHQSLIDAYCIKLKRFLRSHHAVYEDVGELLLKLKYITSKTIPCEKSIALVKNNDLNIYIDILRLRSNILTICTTRLYSMSLDEKYHNIKTVPLDDFYGDALCVAFFTSNIFIHIKCDHLWQACTESENAYTERVCLQLLIGNSYDFWVMIISTVFQHEINLFLIPFSHERIARLKKIFKSSDSREDNIHSTIKFQYFDFGPLGPFRGRDRPLAITKNIESILSLFSMDDDNSDIGINQSWVSSVHLWAVQQRPMSVRAPTVSFVI